MGNEAMEVLRKVKGVTSSNNTAGQACNERFGVKSEVRDGIESGSISHIPRCFLLNGGESWTSQFIGGADRVPARFMFHQTKPVEVTATLPTGHGSIERAIFAATGRARTRSRATMRSLKGASEADLPLRVSKMFRERERGSARRSYE